jgi:hypothetical protein|nr:MAG TPA: hypothetical protein [Caudoviricetes sp.]
MVVIHGEIKRTPKLEKAIAEVILQLEAKCTEKQAAAS